MTGVPAVKGGKGSSISRVLVRAERRRLDGAVRAARAEDLTAGISPAPFFITKEIAEKIAIFSKKAFTLLS